MLYRLHWLNNISLENEEIVLKKLKNEIKKLRNNQHIIKVSSGLLRN